MAVFTSAQDFFVSNRQSKKFELIQKPYVPRALRFSCQGPSRLREAKRAMGTRMVLGKQFSLRVHLSARVCKWVSAI